MIKPLNTKVLVKKPEAITSVNGIMLPDSAVKTVHDRAEVISLGSKVTEDITIGSTVFLAKYCGCEIEYENVKYYMVDCNDIIAIL